MSAREKVTEASLFRHRVVAGKLTVVLKITMNLTFFFYFANLHHSRSC